MSDRKPINVSYSVLSSIEQCTLKFYLSRILKWPEKVWPRTTIGSLVHVILECLALPKHRHHYDAIVVNGDVQYSRSPAIARLIRRWQVKHNLDQKLIDEIDAMLKVALVDVDFFMPSAVKVYPPELEFFVTVDGATIKGVIDRLYDMGDYLLVRDWKSAREKPTKKETEEGYQAAMYQWYCLREFGKPAVVEFVYLRHPPTKFKKDKHLMTVKPIGPGAAKGFEAYCVYMYGVINSFSEEDAKTAPTTDLGFCERVCSHRVPRTYIAIKKRESNALVGTYLPEFAPKPKDDEYAVEMQHGGCPKWNP